MCGCGLDYSNWLRTVSHGRHLWSCNETWGSMKCGEFLEHVTERHFWKDSTLWTFFGVGWDWVHSVRRRLTGLLYQPRMIGGDECGVSGMRIGRGNRSTLRKPAAVPLCPPQIPCDLTWARTGAAAVGNRQLTACCVHLVKHHSLEGDVTFDSMFKVFCLRSRRNLDVHRW
jgi:hypothetical protein